MLMTAVTDCGGSVLRVEALLESALRGRQRDFSDRSFVPALQQLIEACNQEAELSPFGVRALRVDVLRCLRNLLKFDEVEANFPAVLTRPIQAPVFITGMPRSGTTFLHRLILQDPGVAGPRLFQLVYPCASRNRWSTALRRLGVSLELGLFRLIAPDLNALHPIAVDAPEECTDIIAQVFQSLRFDATYRVPSYIAWLQARGFLDAYYFHRRFLQHLDAQQPGRRWVLKSPDHVFALDDIKRVYPDARLVCVHRDPVSVLASVVKLTETLRRPFAQRIDRFEIGREVAASWLDGSERMGRLAASGVSVLNLQYRQIVASPMDAVAAVYRHCDMELTSAAVGRMRAWLAIRANASGRPSRNYSLADFGLDPRALREQFASYTNCFDVFKERDASEAGIGALS
jgi:hypothetical protein